MPETQVPLKPEDVDDETGEIFESTRCELDANAIVAVRWLWVQEHLPAIPKASTNSQQGFKYRSIDDVLKKVHKLFGQAGIFILPARQQATYVEWEGASGKAIHVARVTCDWQVYGANGDWITAQTVGQAADAFDKATSKAQTAAFKYLLWPSLSIAENEDNDGQTPESTVHRSTRQSVEQGGAVVRQRFAEMDQPDPGVKMASMKQVNKVRIQARDLGLAEEGSEMVGHVNSFGEPGWPGSLVKLQAWQISQLIDKLSE